MPTIMALLATLWAEARPMVIVTAFSLSVMTVLELVFPRERQSLSRRWVGLAIWAFYVPFNLIVFKSLHNLWVSIGITPLVTIPLSFSWAGILSIVLAPIAGALVYDFFFYWFHRAQHALAWRFHAVHHSIRELNAVNSFHHVSEPIFQAIFLVLPASLIMADTGPTIPAMLIILQLHASFIHSPTRITLGPLRVFFCDNRFHRIHHSLEEKHFDKNFGAFTTLWDRLFGTAWLPAQNEWPETGLAEVDQPRSLRDWIDLPVRFRHERRDETIEPRSGNRSPA
ncbi:sterol desaturase family protein [Sphingomonas sp.]|uniref:sterol desaturase family protein n=1 Tax=Sphingomonas sp. TaxID=28214 RepID=UPI0025CDBFF9|nr:sterol desaturase family protein [Sphingomonas sp.]